MSDRTKWDERYRDANPATATAAAVLMEFQHLLPQQGNALDLACGLGANARLLASRGLTTSAWDISAAAIARLTATTHGLPLQAEARDLLAHPPPANHFDVIVVSRFLERALCPAIATALRPGGLLFYQTFIRDKTADIGPRNPAYLLARNELLHLFSELDVVAYREEGLLGDTTQGLRNEAWLVAQHPLD